VDAAPRGFPACQGVTGAISVRGVFRVSWRSRSRRPPFFRIACR